MVVTFRYLASFNADCLMPSLVVHGSGVLSTKDRVQRSISDTSVPATLAQAGVELITPGPQYGCERERTERGWYPRLKLAGGCRMCRRLRSTGEARQKHSSAATTRGRRARLFGRLGAGATMVVADIS